MLRNGNKLDKKALTEASKAANFFLEMGFTANSALVTLRSEGRLSKDSWQELSLIVAMYSCARAELAALAGGKSSESPKQTREVDTQTVDEPPKSSLQTREEIEVQAVATSGIRQRSCPLPIGEPSGEDEPQTRYMSHH